MAERIDNLDSADEFGFGRNRKVEVKTTREVDLSSLQDESISSKGFTLEDLMSGETYTATTETLPRVKDSVELALNYEDQHNLAFFGSVYTRVSIAIDRIKNEYPNGFLITQITSGVT